MMIATMWKRSLCAVGGMLAFASPVWGADAAPQLGLAGKGTLVVRGTLPNTATPIDVGGHVAFRQRGSLVRLDVLDVALPGAGAVGNAIATQLFPPGGFTIVADAATRQFTLWSNATRAYYVSSTGDATPAHAAPTAAAASSNPFSFERALRTLAAFDVSFSLASHGVVNGHPATGVNYRLSRTTAKGDAAETHGTIEFADDLDGLPLELTASFKSKDVSQISLRLDATDIGQADAPPADFAVPDGFSRVASVAGVIGRTLPGN